MTAQEKLDLLEDLIYDIGRMLDEAHSINVHGALAGQLDNTTSALASALDETNRITNTLRGEAAAEKLAEDMEKRRDCHRSIGGAY